MSRVTRLASRQQATIPTADLEELARNQHKAALALGHTVHRQGWSFECSNCGRSSSVSKGVNGGRAELNVFGQLFNGEPCSR